MTRAIIIDDERPELENLRIISFGGFVLLDEAGAEVQVRWRTSKSKELMSFLYLKENSFVPKGQIIQSIWPHCSDEQAHSNLHTTLYKMKKALKTAKVEVEVHFKRGSYRMELNRATGDIWEFEAYARKHCTVNAFTAVKAEQILALYTGDLFADADYFWSIPKREEMLALYIQMSKRLCEFFIGEGRFAEAIWRINQLLQRSPLDEEAHELLLGIYFRKKDRVSLVRHYHALNKLLHQELGLEPRESVKKLYNTIMHSD